MLPDGFMVKHEKVPFTVEKKLVDKLRSKFLEEINTKPKGRRIKPFANTMLLCTVKVMLKQEFLTISCTYDDIRLFYVCVI